MKKSIFASLAVLTLAMLACQLPGLTPLSTPESDSQTSTEPNIQPGTGNPVLLDGSLTSLYQKVLPGVVAIQTDMGRGSGFVFDNEGNIITNQHVIDGASTVEVTFSSGFKAFGTVIGTDSDADVA